VRYAKNISPQHVGGNAVSKGVPTIRETTIVLKNSGRFRRGNGGSATSELVYFYGSLTNQEQGDGVEE